MEIEKDNMIRVLTLIDLEEHTIDDLKNLKLDYRSKIRRYSSSI